MQSNNNLAHAKAAYEQGDFDQALTLVSGAISENASEQAFLLLALTLERMELHAQAADAFLQIAQMSADPRPLLHKAVRLSLDGGLLDQARSLALDLRRMFPGDAEGAFVLAKLGLASGDMMLAQSVADDLVASDEPEHLLLAIKVISSNLQDERNLTLFGKLRQHFPDDYCIRLSLLGYAREFCDYDIMRREEGALRDEIARNDFSALAGETPHYGIMWNSDEAMTRRMSNLGTITLAPHDSGQVRLTMPHAWGRKLRIGYLSSDFWDDHATMRLFQSVLEAHDRERFEITLYCTTPDKLVAMDGGNRSKWGRIVRVHGMDDVAVTQAIRADGIDILVDLKGHTEHSRSGVMNLPSAPVHVQWLGFPGTCLNVDCDYIIGDPVVLPDHAKPHYHEKFCRLPECYQPNDPVYRALTPAQSRQAFGLPHDRFVFAAFHSQRKNTLESISIWADVLRANPQSLLWLMIQGNNARRSTAEEFRRHGIKAGQLLFAPKAAYPHHVARVQAADLGLDSFPYNGHTTTSDMLWAGLPVATMRGTHFASRVSESLVRTIGAPELVASDRDDYVRLCTELVEQREKLQGLRNRIAANRFTAPLFDSERFCRHLETAYEMMARRAKSGLMPDHFDVPALPVRSTPFSARVAG